MRRRRYSQLERHAVNKICTVSQTLVPVSQGHITETLILMTSLVIGADEADRLRLFFLTLHVQVLLYDSLALLGPVIERD